jgi:hypothetical protein
LKSFFVVFADVFTPTFAEKHNKKWVKRPTKPTKYFLKKNNIFSMFDAALARLSSFCKNDETMFTLFTGTRFYHFLLI